MTETVSPEGETSVPPSSLAALAGFGAVAGGMGWGIRGQFGHETGAMVPGLLVALVLVLLAAPRATALRAARAVAVTAIAFSFGGSMTYGQTIGLTQDAPLRGHWPAFAWGMLGLAIKGGLWIGLGGLGLGMSLGGKRYRAAEIAGLVLAMIAALLVGVSLLNEPFEPDARALPAVYFSDHWVWEPDAELTPRRERWGGLLAALAAAVLYTSVVKRDRLAVRLALAGVAAGGVGFPAGQCLQSWNAWNPDWILSTPLGPLAPHLDWWKAMEVTFGAIAGGGLGLGLWLSRGAVRGGEPGDEVELRPGTEIALVAVHVPLVVAWNFAELSWVDAFAEHAVTMGLLPLVGVVGGRYWPLLVTFPIVALPIAGKTLRLLTYREALVPPLWGWVLLVALPLAITLAAAAWLGQRARDGHDGRDFTSHALLIATWLYFALSFAEFGFPWPGSAVTDDTLPAGGFFACAVALTWLALRSREAGRELPQPEAARPTS